MAWQIKHGDWINVLSNMPDESVYCCVTSPPYWGLRDYGVSGQLGLERTPDEYVSKVVEGFREVRRVLRKDGTLWLNLGDTYAGSRCGENKDGFTGRHVVETDTFVKSKREGKRWGGGDMACPGLKPKDLIGIPWRVAFALQSDGWYLRQDIIWAKPNPMTESVTDRCTKSHEYLFLLSKSPKYYFDQEAISEASVTVQADWKTPDGWDTSAGSGGHGNIHREGREAEHKDWLPSNQRGQNGRGGKTAFRGQGHARYQETGRANRNGRQMREVGSGETRNKRSVWEIATSPFPEAHFATFPPKLAEPCILAGCPEGGTVLDPFAGAGTTGLVATRLHRNFIGIELNADYIAMARNRITNDAPLFNSPSLPLEEPTA